MNALRVCRNKSCDPIVFSRPVPGGILDDANKCYCSKPDALTDSTGISNDTGFTTAFDTAGVVSSV